MDFEGKTAVVTGGASGIGRRCVERFVDAGANVVIADVVHEPIDHPNVQSVETDVREQDDVEALVETTVEEFGAVDVLVNNAAIYEPLVPKRDRRYDEIPLAEWRDVIDVNTTGVYVCCRAVLPQMEAQGSGSVVNISSAVAFAGVTGYPHYVVSKGAIPSLTRTLAAEVGEHGVRVNAIAPGLVLSAASRQLSSSYIDGVVEKQCLPRPGQPDDVVDVIEFLASEQSSFITGSTLHVDGGMTLR